MPRTFSSLNAATDGHSILLVLRDRWFWDSRWLILLRKVSEKDVCNTNITQV